MMKRITMGRPLQIAIQLRGVKRRVRVRRESTPIPSLARIRGHQHHEVFMGPNAVSHSDAKLRIVTLGYDTARQKWPLNDGQTPMSHA
jgi:hypothetical protein